MNLSKYHYLIIGISTGALIVIAIFFYLYIQTQINAAQITLDEKFNSLTTLSTGNSGSGTVPDLQYTLPNGLVLFDTSVPEQTFDYTSDDSITKFVSAKIPLNNKQYTPTDLVTLSSDYLIINSTNMKLRTIALKKLDELAKEFYTIFKDKIVIVSAYRSYNYQKNLEQGCSPTLCARAGFSEHQLGLAVDIFAATSAGDFLSKAEFKTYYERLMQNAHRYGWHNSYQKGVATDTYQQEPRHWRYLGRELATELYNNQQTFAEWYEKQATEDK